MRLLRHGPKGQEKPALLHTDGTVRDLSAVLPDIGPGTLSPDGMAALARIDASTLPVVPQGRLAVPWTGMRKGCPEQLGFVNATGPIFSDDAIAVVFAKSRTTFHVLSGHLHRFRGPLPVFRRTHPCAPSNWWRTIHRLDSANSVLCCSVFFFYPR